MSRINELIENGFDRLTPEQEEELELLSQQAEEFEANDHGKPAKNA